MRVTFDHEDEALNHKAVLWDVHRQAACTQHIALNIMVAPKHTTSKATAHSKHMYSFTCCPCTSKATAVPPDTAAEVTDAKLEDIWAVGCDEATMFCPRWVSGRTALNSGWGLDAGESFCW